MIKSDYENYLNENLNRNIEYNEYIAEQLDSTINYSEYIAEQLSSGYSYDKIWIRNKRKEKINNIFNKKVTKN